MSKRVAMAIASFDDFIINETNETINRQKAKRKKAKLENKRTKWYIEITKEKHITKRKKKGD